MNKTLKKMGYEGEKIAQQYLEKKGYEILENNFCIRGGEIDIVAKKDEEIIFIEVKMRTNKNFGEIVEQISKNKQDKLIRSAEFFLNEYDYLEYPWRIDVITILKNNDELQIEHLENAITLF